MQLTNMRQLEATIELVTGLHIGAGDAEMHIGGTDSPVLKHPHTNEPYIPGSSLKGKMRSLLEWRAGVIGESNGSPIGFKHLDKLAGDQRKQAEIILKLFGISGGDKADDRDSANAREKVGPTRLAFWDCALDADWVKGIRDQNMILTESKSENMINRISGTAEHPRNIERVPAGARFDFRLTLKELDGDNDLLETVLAGLKLLEFDGIGGSGSRGYGKIKFQFSDSALNERFSRIEPFKNAGNK